MGDMGSGSGSDHSGLTRRKLLRVTGQAAMVAAVAKVAGPFQMVYAQEEAEQVSMVFFPNHQSISREFTDVNWWYVVPSWPEKIRGTPPTRAFLKGKLVEALDAINGLQFIADHEEATGNKPTIAINVACNSGKRYPFTTHAESVAAFVELLKERGAGEVIVADHPGMENVLPPLLSKVDGQDLADFWATIQTGISTGMEALESTGIKAAAESAGARVTSFDTPNDWIHVSEAGLNWKSGDTPSWLRREHGVMTPDAPEKTLLPEMETDKPGFRVPRLVTQVDYIVNFARPSAHVMAGHTGVIKNWYGWVHPMDRFWSHTRVGVGDLDIGDGKSAVTVPDLHKRIAEVAYVYRNKSPLSLVAGIDFYAAVGPDWDQQPLQQSFIFASGGQVAIDAAIAAVVAKEKRDTPLHKRKNVDPPQRPNQAFPLADSVDFWRVSEWWMHPLHGTHIQRDIYRDKSEDDIRKTEQVQAAVDLGLGPADGEYVVVGGAPDDYAKDVLDLTHGEVTVKGESGGAKGAIESGGSTGS